MITIPEVMVATMRQCDCVRRVPEIHVASLVAIGRASHRPQERVSAREGQKPSRQFGCSDSDDGRQIGYTRLGAVSLCRGGRIDNAIWTTKVREFFTSPRLRGEVGIQAQLEFRVRGSPPASPTVTVLVDRAPHPNPLSASEARRDPAKSGERETQLTSSGICRGSGPGRSRRWWRPSSARAGLRRPSPRPGDRSSGSGCGCCRT
jgi:hypothetical protein